MEPADGCEPASEPASLGGGAEPPLVGPRDGPHDAAPETRKVATRPMSRKVGGCFPQQMSSPWWPDAMCRRGNIRAQLICSDVMPRDSPRFIRCFVADTCFAVNVRRARASRSTTNHAPPPSHFTKLTFATNSTTLYGSQVDTTKGTSSVEPFCVTSGSGLCRCATRCARAGKVGAGATCTAVPEQRAGCHAPAPPSRGWWHRCSRAPAARRRRDGADP